MVTLHNFTGGDKTKDSYYLNLTMKEIIVELRMRREMAEIKTNLQKIESEKNKPRKR